MRKDLFERKPITVGELRKHLVGLPEDMPVYIGTEYYNQYQPLYVKSAEVQAISRYYNQTHKCLSEQATVMSTIAGFCLKAKRSMLKRAFVALTLVNR